LYNRKAKLGGSGVGLYALALYQRLFNDDRYADAAQRLATDLVNEINEQGEFRYYHIYLDQPVAWEDNQRYFSFCRRMIFRRSPDFSGAFRKTSGLPMRDVIADDDARSTAKELERCTVTLANQKSAAIANLAGQLCK
jgi:hypothetical protein